MNVNTMNSQTKLILVIVFICLLLGVFAYFALKSSNSDEPDITTSQTEALLTYNEQKDNKLLEVTKKKPKLDTQDAKIRAELVAIAKDGDGLVIASESYKISYLDVFDIFEVEINYPDIGQAHKEATDWFLSKGLSQKGLCNLPVSFFASTEISKSVTTATEVNPLPDGC